MKKHEILEMGVASGVATIAFAVIYSAIDSTARNFKEKALEQAEKKGFKEGYARAMHRVNMDAGYGKADEVTIVTNDPWYNDETVIYRWKIQRLR